MPFHMNYVLTQPLRSCDSVCSSSYMKQGGLNDFNHNKLQWYRVLVECKWLIHCISVCLSENAKFGKFPWYLMRYSQDFGVLEERFVDLHILTAVNFTSIFAFELICCKNKKFSQQQKCSIASRTLPVMQSWWQVESYPWLLH